jgi:hypothetical protein
VKVHDELGRSWLVLDGDPAWDVCGKLKKLAPSAIILPTETLARGIVPHPDRAYEQMHRLQTAWTATDDKDIKDAFVRAVILYDCLMVCYNRSGET